MRINTNQKQHWETDFSPELEKALELIKNNASISESDGSFLSREFQWLRECGALSIVLPGMMLDFQGSNTQKLLGLLRKIGKANLSVGRLYEGHVNALYLIHLYANPLQKERYYKGIFEEGNLFGIWNTQDNEGIHLKDYNGSCRIDGSKTFCSGASIVNHAIITGDFNQNGETGWQMCLINMNKIGPERIGKNSWRPLGMQATGSFKVNFTGVDIDQEDLLSSPGIYLKQPHFSAGAIRFAAVHLGGAESICEETIAYLRQLNRLDDPFQSLRISRMMSSLTMAGLLLEDSGQKFDNWSNDPSMSEALINCANLTRVNIEDRCLEIMEDSNRCVGARGLMKPGSLERNFRDLSFYLRQPAPDVTRVNIGKYYLQKSH